ncbi:MAG TPA: hypothetical protein VFZ66_28440 [Herpetosiphonaceae bacterium]
MRTPFVWTKQYVFKPMLLGHLFRLFVVFVLGAAFIVVYAETRVTIWLVAVGGCVVAASMLVWSYNANIVLIHNGEIVVQRWLQRQPIVVLIVLNDIEVRQSMVEKLLDCGTLYMELDGKQRKLASISGMAVFNSVVAERQDVIRQLLTAYRQQLQAQEREIGQFLGHAHQQPHEAFAR